MKACFLAEPSPDPDHLRVEVKEVDLPRIAEGECLIEIHAGSVNNSDVRAVLGKMPDLVWPRIPGRDFAGVVVDGPGELVGREVWGTGGELGMSRDGNHAQYAVIKAMAAVEKPSTLSMRQAGCMGVTWTCAYPGLAAAAISAEDVVVVLGANGAVGQASIQIATDAGARVVGIERSRDDYGGHANGPVEIINLAKEPDLKAAVMARTGGHGADVVMNVVGSPYLEIMEDMLANEGRHVIVQTIDDEALLNLRRFYRRNHRLIGVSNLEFDHLRSAAILEELRPKFENGTYRPYAIDDERIYPLEKAAEAYAQVLNKVGRGRVVIDPKLS